MEDEINETEKRVMVLNEQADAPRGRSLPFSDLYRSMFDVTSSLLQVAQREAIVSNAEIARLERDLGQRFPAVLGSNHDSKPYKLRAYHHQSLPLSIC